MNHRSNLMRQQLRIGATVLALLAGTGLAAAQRAPGYSGSLDLSADQQHAVSRGLSGQQAQRSDAASQAQQAQVGSKLSDSVQTQPVPDNVASDVPAAKNMFFVKLPDRVLLINPDDRMIAEIILDTDTGTTGAGTSGSGSGGSGNVDSK